MFCIFTSNTPYSHAVLELLLEHHAKDIEHVFLSSPGPFSKKLGKLAGVWKRAGAEYTLKKLGFLLGNSQRSPSVLLGRYDVSFSSISGLSSETAKQQIAACQSGLFVSVFFDRIFPASLLESGGTFVNVHPSLLPAYAGISPVFWAMSGNEDQIGATLHYVDAGIDTGPIIAQATLPLTPGESAHSAYLRCCGAAAKLLNEYIPALSKGKVSASPQDSAERSYFGEPTRDGYRRLKENGYTLF